MFEVLKGKNDQLQIPSQSAVSKSYSMNEAKKYNTGLYSMAFKKEWRVNRPTYIW